jgi:hypothetical protein
MAMDFCPALDQGWDVAVGVGNDAVMDAADALGQVFRVQDHAEIAPASADCPEQVGVLVRRDVQQLAVGRDDVGGDHAVDRESARADYPADPTQGGQASDADRSGVTRGQRQVMLAEDFRYVAPLRTRPEANESGVAVEDLDRGHRAHVDQNAAIRRAPPLAVVSSTADGQGQARVDRVTDCRSDVGGVARTDDQGRRPGPHVHGCGVQVAGVTGPEKHRCPVLDWLMCHQSVLPGTRTSLVAGPLRCLSQALATSARGTASTSIVISPSTARSVSARYAC